MPAVLLRIDDRTIARRVGEDVVVIDRSTSQAHALSGDLAVLWRSLEDGTLGSLPPGLVETAGAQLAGLGLLGTAGPTRRSVLTRGALVVAGAGVASIALPEAVAAASVGAVTPGFSYTTPPPGTVATNYISPTFNGGAAVGTYAFAQSFTPGVGGSLTGIGVAIAANGAQPTSVLFQIRPATGTPPLVGAAPLSTNYSVQLATSTVPVATTKPLTVAPTLYLTFATPYQVVAATTYYLCIIPTGGQVIWFNGSSASTQYLSQSGNAGASWSAPSTSITPFALSAYVKAAV